MIAPQTLGHFQPVHLRHLPIDQQQSKRLPFASRVRDGAQSRLATVSLEDLGALRLEHLARDRAGLRVVIDDQGPDAAQLGIGYRTYAERRFLGDTQLDRELENAALAGNAVRANVTAHLGDQARYDREAQTAAAIAPCGR